MVDGYASTYAIPKFDLLIDWGWFYFLTKPLFYALDYFYRLVGNFGVVDPNRHRADQARAFPARQQVLCVDEPDEEAGARDAEAQGALSGRSHASAASDDGPVQEGKGEPGFGLFADPRADPSLLCALQGPVRHHRDAARALLRMDQGPLGARPDLGFQSVRPHTLGPAARSSWWVLGRSSWARPCGSR